MRQFDCPSLTEVAWISIPLAIAGAIIIIVDITAGTRQHMDLIKQSGPSPRCRTPGARRSFCVWRSGEDTEIGMLVGIATALPMNGLLVIQGTKERM